MLVFRKRLLTYYMDIIILYIYLQVDILYSHKMTIKEKIKNDISLRKNNEQNKLKLSVSSKRNSNKKKKQKRP